LFSGKSQSGEIHGREWGDDFGGIVISSRSQPRENKWNF
jgi:hypothetical protein